MEAEVRADYFTAIAAAAVTGVGLAAAGIYAAHSYGWVLFLAVPVAMGFAASAVLRLYGQRPLLDSMLCTLGAALVASLGFLFAGLEGLICVFLAVPLASPFLAIGGFLGYFAFHHRRVPVASSVAMLLMVAVAALLEPRVHGAPPMNIVEDSIVVHAPVAEVWRAVVALDVVPPPKNWMYRAGLACPQRTRIQSQRAGGYRVCTLSTGQLVEQIEVWRPEQVLRWRSRLTPPPMHEMNPFHREVHAPHLRGYYESPRGEFALERIGPRLTRLTRRTWYTQRLYPSVYWGFFSEMGISQIHRTVLEHVRDMAEERDTIGART